MNTWGIIAIIIGIVVLIGVYNEGWDGFKNKPFQSSTNSVKTIYDTGKNVVDTFKEESDIQELVDIGKIPCTNNEDCNNFLEDCNNNCTCYDDGICRR